jgi:hypothetical protein
MAEPLVAVAKLLRRQSHSRKKVVMNKKPVLVDEEELRTLIDGLDLRDKKKNEYLKARWLNQV